MHTQHYTEGRLVHSCEGVHVSTVRLPFIMDSQLHCTLWQGWRQGNSRIMLSHPLVHLLLDALAQQQWLEKTREKHVLQKSMNKFDCNYFLV